MCVYVKHEITKYIKRVYDTCRFGINLLIDEALTQLSEDALAIFVYLMRSVVRVT